MLRQPGRGTVDLGRPPDNPVRTNSQVKRINWVNCYSHQPAQIRSEAFSAVITAGETTRTEARQTNREAVHLTLKSNYSTETTVGLK